MKEPTADRTQIAGRSLADLRDRYHRQLFDEFLPLWDRHGVDHELGGFLCSRDLDGNLRDDSKYMWYQGRGLWTYSYLYNHFGGQEHLEVARKTRDFLLRHGRDEDGNWVTGLDREGNVTGPAEARGYTAMFVAEGLQEYARATGDQESMELAIDSLLRAMGRWDDPEIDTVQGYIPLSYPGMRTLGSHMIAILILSQILSQHSDPKLEALADRVVDGIVNRFWNTEYQLTNEALNHDYERPDDDNEDFIYLGHAIETLWMLMPEAMRRRDKALFDLAAERFRRHMEVAWDDVYDGFFRAVEIHGSYTFDKVLWLQEEVLIGAAILMEHTTLEWPREWFARTYEYVQDRFYLGPHGYRTFTRGGDRKVTFNSGTSRADIYHHPRHLMRNLLAFQRMAERGGEASGFWAR